MSPKPRPELVLWGFHPKHGNVTMKLETYSATAQRRRTREGWTCGAYAAGDSPEGLELQASVARRTARPMQRNAATVMDPETLRLVVVQVVRMGRRTARIVHPDGRRERVPGVFVVVAPWADWVQACADWARAHGADALRAVRMAPPVDWAEGLEPRNAGGAS